jgi:hypothetical protein
VGTGGTDIYSRFLLAGIMAKKLTVREYDKKAEELIKRIRSEVKPFADDSDAARKERRERGKKDWLWFCQTYLPHHFDEPMSRWDKKLAKLVHLWNKIIEIMAFRGWGKSTKIVVGFGIYASVYELEKYFPIISDTEPQAMKHGLPIKVEFEENPRIRQDFGDMVTHNWAKEEFELSNGVSWECLSWTTMKLGRKFKQHRPGIAFVDDIENEKNVKSPDQVKQRLDFLLSTLVPGMTRKRWKIFYLTTRLARYCVAGELEKNPEVVKFNLPAETKDKEGRRIATDPKRFPLDHLDKIRDLIGVVRYARNYLLKVLSDETRPYQENFFVWIPRPENRYRYKVSGIDPSVGQTKRHSFKAIVTAGWPGEHNEYDILHAWIRQTTINHMLMETYQIHEDFRPFRIVLESNNFQILLKGEYERLSKHFGYQLPLKPIYSKENKIIRVERPSPLVENGLIRFVRGSGDMDRLQMMLLDFDPELPAGQQALDGPDAMDMALEDLKRLAGRRAKVQAAVY